MGSSTRENVPESRSGMMNGCEEASTLIEGNRILILIKERRLIISILIKLTLIREMVKVVEDVLI